MLFWAWSFFICVDGTSFDSRLAFCSGCKLVWAFLGFVVRLVASLYLSPAHMELPNHSVPTPLQDVTQSVHMCYFANGPG